MPPITAEEMERVTCRMPAEMVDQLDRRVEAGLFPNRSEAIRAAVRGEFDLVKRTSL